MMTNAPTRTVGAFSPTTDQGWPNMAKVSKSAKVPRTPPGITPRWRARDRRFVYDVRLRDPAGDVYCRTFATLEEARRYRSAERADRARGDWIDQRKGRRLFDDWADDYVAACAHLKAKTRDRYRSALDCQVRPTFGAMPVGAIDTAAVRVFLSELRASGAGRGTVANARTVLSGVLGFAADAGAIRSNPARGARVGGWERREEVFLTATQVELLAAAIAAPPVRERGGEHRRATFPDCALAVRVAAYTGLRSGELWALHVQDLDLLHRRVHVVQSVTDGEGQVILGPTKNYERRTVPIPATLIDPLRDHVAGLPMDALVFTNSRGGLVRHGNWYRRHYVPAVQRAGLPDGTHFHTLRHTCAALLAGAGLSELEVMKQLGHRQPVRTYAHLFPDATDRAAAALDVITADAQRAHAEHVAPVVVLAREKRAMETRPRRRRATGMRSELG